MANKIRLTEANVSTLVCAEGKRQDLYGDTLQQGLYVRVTNKGSRSYVFEASVKNKTVRITIAAIKDRTLEQAKAQVRLFQTQIDAGLDPRDVITTEAEKQRVEANAIRMAKVAAAHEARRESVTLADVWPVYIAAQSSNWGEHHIRDHESVARRPKGVLAALLDVRLADLTTEKLADWLEHEARTRPTVTAKAYRLLRACLNWCEERDEFAGILPAVTQKRKSGNGIEPVLAFNAKDVRKAVPRVGEKKDALEAEMLPDFFEAVRQLDNRYHSVYLQTLLLIGSRPSELLALKWSDVDFRIRALTVRDKDESKGGKDGTRLVPMGLYVVSLLTGLHKAAAKDSKGEPIGRYVFAGRGTNGAMSLPNHALTRVALIGGLPHITLHGLRRSYQTLSEGAEIPSGVAAQIAGHKPSATNEKYRVRSLAYLRTMQDKFEEWLLTQGKIMFERDTAENPTPFKLLKLQGLQ